MGDAIIAQQDTTTWTRRKRAASPP